MPKITLKSYPKINLTLDVMEKDQKAEKHFLNTFFYRVDSLFDTIELHRRDDDQNFVHCDYPGVARGELNTVIKALDLLNEKGWEVSIYKKIPVGAGLGGGSSNAGAVLKYFAEKKGIPIDHILPLAQQVGADVPFFLLDENLAYAEGFGDQIVQSWTIPSLPVEIIQTGIKVNTPEAYEVLELENCGLNSVKTEALLIHLKQGTGLGADELPSFIHNDFEGSFFQKYPSLKGKGYLCGSGGAMWRFA